MSPLPLPIRLAAGLAAIALERARKLPQDVSEWPMTAVSQALQISMRVQQRITELAIKGDEALAALREPEEEPPWAVFDEDLPEPSYLRPQTEEPPPLPEEYDFSAQGTTTAEERSWFKAIDEVYALPGAELAADRTPTAETATVTPLDSATETATDSATDVPAATEVPAATDSTTETATETGAVVPAATEAPTAPAPPETAVVDGVAPADGAIEPRTETGYASAPAAQHERPKRRTRADEPLNTNDRTGEHAGTGVPAALPIYPGLSLASVRGRLRVLTAADLEELLAYERGHGDRPEFVRMLTNRLAMVRGNR
jgi:hypothetical protein